MQEPKTFKLILLGSVSVGKTSCINTWVNGIFCQQIPPTLSARFDNQIIEIDGVNYNFQVWDTAGQDTFMSTTSLYCRNANGAAIVFDVTNRSSFNDVPEWINTLYGTAPNIPLVLIGNKCDLIQNYQDFVTLDEGQKLADQYKCLYYQASAKTGCNIEEAFNYLAVASVKNPDISQEESPNHQTNNDSKKLDEKRQNDTTDDCC